MPISRVQIFWSKDGTHFFTNPTQLDLDADLQLQAAISVAGEDGPHSGTLCFYSQKNQEAEQLLAEVQVDFGFSCAVLSPVDFEPMELGHYTLKARLEVGTETWEGAVQVHVVDLSGGEAP